jgi:N-acetylglucosamine malate deacetylase 2
VDDSSQPALIIAAHPDDEVIGLGSRLPEMKSSALIVHSTDGAPLTDALVAGFSGKEAYADARRQELAAALALAGISTQQCHFLGFGDQEASLHLEGLTHQIIELLREIKPAIIFTHPYEGGHPDHDATAFAVHSAVKLSRNGGSGPGIYEFTSYHAAPGGMETSEFLPCSGNSICSKVLNEQERLLKTRMLHCFVTQQHVLQQFSLSVEKTRSAPSYDFSQAPHTGKLYYENFAWGVDGTRWRELAREAEQALGIKD